MNDHRNRFWRRILMTELLICLVAVALGMSRARADELRPIERQKLRFMYFSSSLGSSRDLSRSIEFGDATFPVSAFVRADLDIRIVELAYEFVTRLDIEDDRFLGRLRFHYGGPLAFVTVSF